MNAIHIVLVSSILAMFTSSGFAQSAMKKAEAPTPAAQADMATKDGEVAATNKAQPMELKLAGDKLTFTAPGAWEKVQPRSRILEAELKVPATAEGEKDGRITIMRAGGSIPENIARWEGQFTKADGAIEAKTEKEDVAGKQVHLVDITGTFEDSMGRGPFAGGKKVARENYHMSAAIIETGAVGNYFFKFIGPKSVVEPNVKAFKEMIRTMKLSE